MKTPIQLLTLMALVAHGSLAMAADSDGFTNLFDGQTLKGWKAADLSYWSVEDGAITARITPEHPLKDNLYLIWEGGAWPTSS